MDLALTDEQALLSESARAFLARNVAFDEVAKAEDEPGVDPLGLWGRFAELGWTGLLVPVEAGGAGALLTDGAVLAHELGRALAPSPFVAVSAAVTALRQAPAAPAIDEVLRAVAAGTAQPVLAVGREDGRWVRGQPGARAASGRVTGVIGFVVGALGPGPLVVLAGTEDGDELCLVEPDQPEVDIAAMATIGGPAPGTVRMASAHGVGLGTGWQSVADALVTAGTLQAAWCAGATARLLEDTVAYVSERHQFGVPIGSFQAVQHRLADASILAAEAEALAYGAAHAADLGDPSARRLASTAILHATDAFVRVARDAHQVWGGLGFSTEAHVHLFSRRAKAAQHEWGGPDLHLDIVAEELATAPLLLHRYLPRLGRA